MNSRVLSNLARGLLSFINGSFATAIAVWVLPGLTAGGVGAVLAAYGVVLIVNSLAWPLISRHATVILVWTLGLAAIAFNAGVLMLADRFVPGFAVSGWGTAVAASFIMTATTAGTAAVLSIDDDDVYRRNMVRKTMKRIGTIEHADSPGYLFIQIDGLSAHVLRNALTSGHAPTMAKWIRDDGYRLTEWECDLSSQTGASQAGILHGDNSDMPAFRWFDKSLGRVITTNRPHDAALIESSRRGDDGLLKKGASRANVFSGGSDDALFVFSTVLDGPRPLHDGLEAFFSDPYSMSRLIVLSIDDIVRELLASWRARRRRVEPRLGRGGIYPLLRAGTTVALRDITIGTLVGDVMRGVPVVYADMVGYDEVAHHSGILAHDALEVLYRTDRHLARLASAVEDAPRPYNIIILSDHGQTQGATFKQRYDESLSDVVAGLVGGSGSVAAPQLPSEGWGNINGVLGDTVRDSDSRTARLMRRLLKSHTVDNEITLGADLSELQPDADDNVVVLASGNLGLVSFRDIEGRATLEALARRFPGLVDGLVGHPGIGFVLVRSESEGSMAIGGSGVCYLKDGHVDGGDPLAPFGPNALEHLRRTDSFSNAPDLLINGFYDPATEEGAAFEELIGFHGGLGGHQTAPFLLSPAGLDIPDEPLVGASSIHQLLLNWSRDA